MHIDKVLLLGILSIFIAESAYAQSENIPDFFNSYPVILSSDGDLEENPEFFNNNTSEDFAQDHFAQNQEPFDFDSAFVSSHSGTGSVVLEGIIRDSDSNPVSDLNINLFGTMNPSRTFSNSEGYYSLKNEPETYGLFLQSLSHNNFPNFPNHFNLLSSSLHLTSNTVQDLTIPNISLDVTVIDQKGNPINDSTITAVGKEYSSKEVAENLDFYYYFRETAQTDQFGKTSLNLFPSSEVKFVIMPPDSSKLSPFLVFLPVYNDSEIIIKYPTPVKFEGTIDNKQGSKISDLLVFLYSDLNKFYDLTDSNGNYFVDVVPGNHNLYLLGYPDYDYPNLPAVFGFHSTDFVKFSKDKILDLTLPTVSLDVTVLDFEGNPVIGSSITASGEELKSKNLSPEIEFNYHFSDSSLTNDSGKTSLDLLQSGEITVTIIPPNGSNLKPLHQNGLSLFENDERAFVLESNSIENISNNPIVRIPLGSGIPGCETLSICFIPYDLQVYRGSTVIWSNDDTSTHTVTAGTASGGPSGKFDSSLFLTGTTFSHTFENIGVFEYFCMIHPWMNGKVTVSEKPFKESSGGNEWDTRPTFGESHETENQLIVENGFTFNSNQFTLTDNHHTDFDQQSILVGTTNSFSAKVYADKKLKVQEFLFGIPNVGESHLAELGVEVWYDNDGNIEDIRVNQKSNVIDETSLIVSHDKTKCASSDIESKCDTTKVSMTFLEPLKDNVMAIKAIDFKNRDQRTYLNDGFDVSGESLNPMKIKMIPSTIKNEGLLKVTQVEKYSTYWITEDGRIFEMNSFGSFKQVNPKFERFSDSGNAFTRMHSDFDKIVDYEKERAQDVFDSTKIISELPDSFDYHFEITERMNDEIKREMTKQENIAKKILDRMDMQTRHH